MQIRALLLMIVVLMLASCGSVREAASSPRAEAKSTPAQIPPEFWKTWGDGNAELAGYDLTFSRYGQPRQGVAVTIFVTEPFSASSRVKADPGKHPETDVFPVMKLNLIEDFQTGIYDYNEMTSSFAALNPGPGVPAGAPVKVAFASQEWCGHTYLQTLFDRDRLRYSGHSYFDGEADEQSELPVVDGAFSEDLLWHWSRGMAEPRLKPGETRSVRMLPTLQSLRHSHKEPALLDAKLERLSGTREIETPAGKFTVETWSSTRSDGMKRTFFVEQEAPHRIAAWESTAGEKAAIVASKRLPYWKMNAPGGEAALKELGLQLRPPRTM